jgi:large subunit ribosomal protein L18
LYGQLVDDGKRKTLGSVRQKGTNSRSGALLGDSIVALCKEKKVKQLVFDRGGYKYHGVIKRIAETVREGGVII